MDKQWTIYALINATDPIPFAFGNSERNGPSHKANSESVQASASEEEYPRVHDP